MHVKLWLQASSEDRQSDGKLMQSFTKRYQTNGGLNLVHKFFLENGESWLDPKRFNLQDIGGRLNVNYMKSAQIFFEK